jgi:protein-tyrosine kinase
MDHIQQAIERAKEFGGPGGQFPQAHNVAEPGAVSAAGKEVRLNDAYLESKRVVSHDIIDGRSKSFDMLRTQVLQSMDLKSWQFIGVTSPTPGCGKTMVSVNLALSIARQPHRSVLLVDLDLQRPEVANTLGVKPEAGVIQVLEGKKELHEALVRIHVRNDSALVLPCANSTVRSSAWMASQSMTSLLQDIKRDFRGWTVIVDLPPVLTSDDVITVLPQLDCVLFVAAIGTTTIAEIKECNKHLQSTSIVRVVANKAENIPSTYYSRYAHPSATVE